LNPEVQGQSGNIKIERYHLKKKEKKKNGEAERGKRERERERERENERPLSRKQMTNDKEHSGKKEPYR
jgi:hypothetical protein